MNKKRAVKLIILTGIILIFGTISVLGVKKMAEPSIKEKQIAFLKKHENEMNEYIENSAEFQISKITYNWDSVTENTIGNGLPKGAGKVIQIFGFVNNQENLDFRLDLQIDDSNLPDLNTIKYGQPLTDEGE
ncbi:hypothetical protein ACWOC9_18260 [Enterococcus termitis]|uniref:DUF1433 domain-containing protein n=1 Tax=Enterococcus termitis TaxID=332950 RepID=A0A1E5GAM5_9ENTE|nr:hypothetical protein [Enterococcus termitis]OEG09758.1 hypothetical protein BCR25_09620 [Enterococcus termitis]